MPMQSPRWAILITASHSMTSDLAVVDDADGGREVAGIVLDD